MATRQDTSKPQEQAKQSDQPRQPEQQAKPSEQAKSAPARPTETGMAPSRGAPMARAGGREPLSRLRDEFDRLFDQFARSAFGMPLARWDAGTNWGLDVREDDDNVVVRAEAPGFEPSDFDIQVSGNQLIMSAVRKAEEEEEGYRGWRRNEFYEAVTLPAGVDAEKVNAAYRHGVLTVTLPKSEDRKARRIAVQG